MKTGRIISIKISVFNKWRSYNVEKIINVRTQIFHSLLGKYNPWAKASGTPTHSITISLNKKAAKKQHDETVHNSQTIRIYTDGSGIKGQIGAAAHFPELSKSRRSSDNCGLLRRHDDESKQIMLRFARLDIVDLYVFVAPLTTDFKLLNLRLRLFDPIQTSVRMLWWGFEHDVLMVNVTWM